MWRNSDKKGTLLEIKAPPSSLSYTIAALKPARCAYLTLSSNVHPPLIIKANGGTGPCTAFFVNGEHASKGSAMYSTPHSPDPFTGGAAETKDHQYGTKSVLQIKQPS